MDARNRDGQALAGRRRGGDDGFAGVADIAEQIAEGDHVAVDDDARNQSQFAGGNRRREQNRDRQRRGQAEAAHVVQGENSNHDALLSEAATRSASSRRRW